MIAGHLNNIGTHAFGDGTLTADFTGTEPQRANGLNCPVASTISMAHYAVQAVFAPDQLLNDGFNRAIELVLPKDSLINPRAPAAVSCRHLTEQAVADVVLKALAQIAPDLSTAGSQISFPTFGIGGFDHRHRRWRVGYAIHRRLPRALPVQSPRA